MTILTIQIIQKLFKKRVIDSHKGNFGHALLLAGNTSKMGAVIISASACLRSGAGLVTVNIPKKERSSIFSAIPEAMIEFRENSSNWATYNSFAIGPGIGVDKHAENLLITVLSNVNQPIVLDADALNILSKNINLLPKIPKNSILTPHPKEFDRLFGNHLNELDRRKKSIIKASELQCIIVLKGHKTFITDGKVSYENSTGNSGLAKGGSGDALTGMITAFLAQDYESLNAAVIGVYLHGLASDITLETQSEESMLITDVIENIGKAFKKIQK